MYVLKIYHKNQELFKIQSEDFFISYKMFYALDKLECYLHTKFFSKFFIKGKFENRRILIIKIGVGYKKESALK